jgi:hypothetical protein
MKGVDPEDLKEANSDDEVADKLEKRDSKPKREKKDKGEEL